MHTIPATLSEVPELVALVNSAYRGEDGQHGWTNESHLVAGARTTPASLTELLHDPDAVILTCRDDKGILTACVYLQKQGEKLYLGLLSVLPALQGAGIGKLLLAAALAHAEKLGCTRVRISVISLRHELIAWYERHGYQRTGETSPFHAGNKFGIQKQLFELVYLESPVDKVAMQ